MNERDRSNGARNFPGSFFKFCEPLEKGRARFSEKKILPKSALVRKSANVLRTFGVGVVEVQLLDLSGPRHGRQRF